ncbi:MAG: hypothetical protein COA32_16145 [Fluviicola sp.]|nr:MAG: hypothetical protein COA32_16145 [Fluviicola sp.]
MKNNSFFLALLATLTLGLAPFAPEPHFFGKIRWVLGGAEGMQAMDWFDLVMHGAPWIWLVIESVRLIKSKVIKH